MFYRVANKNALLGKVYFARPFDIVFYVFHFYADIEIQYTRLLFASFFF